ncbi:MAG: GFA family protein [Bdellovibrionaceae bacterium]|nr:GFA family protein [Pseudobdellovibrionaceae bacterium]
MIQGSCLCGQVQFEAAEVVGPFELCHCNRCRKFSGSAFMAGVYAKRDGFRFLRGIDFVNSFEAPILEKPPAYRSCFCRECGSPMPDPKNNSALVEIPAGTLDENPGIQPDKHIFVEFKATWFHIEDSLPQFDKISLRKHRADQERE